MSEEPSLRTDSEIGPSLVAIARSLLARVSLDSQGDDAGAIHGFRREVKRWRAYLRLLEPMLGEDVVRLRYEARDMARALAGARDAQAALDALADLGEDYAALSETSVATITARIHELRATEESKTLTPQVREQLRATLARTADAIDSWPLGSVGFQDVAAALAEGYRRARDAIPRNWSVATADELHELRSRIVVHRYQMELAEPLWPRLGKLWVAEAQRLRDRLGKGQDLAVLAKLTAPRQLLARWRSRLKPAIESRQRDHIETAMRQSGRLFAEKPTAFQRRLEALWTSRGGTV